ncbi:sex peptide receptor-like [Octopus vulgaris]|uniref:Sex peptide receptor-like n=2 Tax=Octopus TaxID=6643 RepID=A0AA36B9P7_OCTVU|nr:sex peptide receptor-like [Octopus sinensis]CAI9729656.1 sex peptide receptor-like [Octopus vulgaris]
MFLNDSYDNMEYAANMSLWENVSSIATSLTDVTSNNSTFEDPERSGFMKFSAVYEKAHGYISVTVCIFGVISNILNIFVLTRKHMISPTNYILTALAIFDMFTMTTYIPYATYLYIFASPSQSSYHPYAWVLFIVIHNNFIITCHTIALWLTVSLAVFRYIFVCHHTQAPTLCNLARSKLTVLITVGINILFCIPNYAQYVVSEMPPDGDHTSYWISQRDLPPIFFTITYWLFGVLMKVAPCTFLTILSAILIHAMHKAEKRKARLHSQGSRATQESSSTESNRTTKMLIAVVLSVVITELPQGILALISGINQDFFSNVYVPLGDVMDILVLINSAINFILYCIMSQAFRKTFRTHIFNVCVNNVRNRTNKNGVTYSSIQTEVTQV